MLLKMSSNFIKVFLNMNFNHKFKYSENGRTIVCSKRDEKIKPKCKEDFYVPKTSKSKEFIPWTIKFRLLDGLL